MLQICERAVLPPGRVRGNACGASLALRLDVSSMNIEDQLSGGNVRGKREMHGGCEMKSGVRIPNVNRGEAGHGVTLPGLAIGMVGAILLAIGAASDRDRLVGSAPRWCRPAATAQGAREKEHPP